jgi:hypothetical protein
VKEDLNENKASECTFRTWLKRCSRWRELPLRHEFSAEEDALLPVCHLVYINLCKSNIGSLSVYGIDASMSASISACLIGASFLKLMYEAKCTRAALSYRELDESMIERARKSEN